MVNKKISDLTPLAGTLPNDAIVEVQTAAGTTFSTRRDLIINTPAEIAGMAVVAANTAKLTANAANVDAAGAVMNSDASTAAMGFVVDEDAMGSDSDTKVPTQQSVKAHVAAQIAAAVVSNVVYKGGYNAATNTPDLDTAPSGILSGWMYTVTVAGTFFATAVEVGDVLISEIDTPTVEADWTIVNKNLDAASIKVAYESNADTNAFTDTEKTLLGNQSGTNTGDEAAASATVAGIVELATIAEVDTGTDTVRAVTPAGLAGSALAAAVAANSAKVTNATHTGDVTGSGVLAIGALKVTGAMVAANTLAHGKLEIAPTMTMPGNNTGGATTLLNLTPAQIRTMLATPSVSSGAGTPSSTPAAVGDEYHDTTNDLWYKAKGIATSADWKLADKNMAGGFWTLNGVAAPTLDTAKNLTLARDAIGTYTATLPAGLPNSDVNGKDYAVSVTPLESTTGAAGIVLWSLLAKTATTFQFKFRDSGGMATDATESVEITVHAIAL